MKSSLEKQKTRRRDRDKMFFDFTGSSVSFLRGPSLTGSGTEIEEKTKNRILGYPLV